MTYRAKLSGFDLPHLPSHHPTRRILASALKKASLGDNFDLQDIFWDAAYLGLDQVTLFQAATGEEQAKILQQANRDLLEEIYWVEQAGVGYMGKMLTLAETHEERLLYGLFAADEATHLGMIAPFLGDEPCFRGDHFLSYMGQLIESSDKALLMILVQVVLEGWGLTHYRSLAKSCLNSQLGEVLRGFLDAESRHHGLGVIQVQAYGDYSGRSLAEIEEALGHFLRMVQVGPQRLLKAIERGLGSLSLSEKMRILEELQTESYSHCRLQLLRSLMVGTVPQSILQSLEEQGAFQAYPATQCV